MAALQTAQAVIAGYNAWSLDAILSPRAENCPQYILPASLNIKPMTNAEYAAFFALNLALYRDFMATVHDTFYDAAARKVSMWVTSSAMTDIGPYANEYMIVVHLNEEETKAVRVVEFVDSAYSIRFRGRLAKAQLEKTRKKSGSL